MTEGATLYLVSACGSAEEFVAAFRRYADRTGLFIPASTPLPAGRRGRLALTLKDGGVMIEGEAEIIQSSVKPTIMHGRPGMTIKFLAPDDPSKTVIAELEKARLAMKPAPPSVPPRPAEIPAEPRPVVPPTGGRIDAANALAECVVIGDASQLRDASKPKPGADAASAKKFLVPEIPGSSGRAKTPSVPPEPARPRTPSTPPDLGARPRTPSTPPDPASKPVPLPAHVPPSKPLPSSKLTSIGFPVLDKLPAAPAAPEPAPAAAPAGKRMVHEDNPLLKTLLGTAMPANSTREMTSARAAIVDEEATTIGEAPVPVKTDGAVPQPIETQTEESTDVSSPPPAPAAAAADRSGANSAAPSAAASNAATEPTSTEPGAPIPTDPAATEPTATEPAPAPSGLLAPPPPPAPAPPPPRAPAAPLPTLSTSTAKQQQKMTQIGFPAIRTPFETQQIGTVVPPVVAKTDRSGPPAAPRGKRPTKPPPGPRLATPVAPLPVARPPARSIAPIIEDEETEITGGPPQPPEQTTGSSETAVAGAAYTDAARAADDAVNTPVRSGGMRASEILAAIPTADWTMAPDASKPTVMPSKGWTPIAGMPKVKPPVTDDEPEDTPAPSGPPKGPPTGDWTISLDPSAPEAGWSAPAKPQTPAASPRQAKAGNPSVAVVGDKPIQAVEWEEKPTGIGEAKIEVDPTLIRGVDPMPADDDDSVSPLAEPPAPSAFDLDGPSPFAAPPPRAMTEPLAGTALGAMLRPPTTPAKLVGSRPSASTIPAPETPIALPLAAPMEPQPPAPMFDTAMFPQTAQLPGRSRLLLVIGLSVLALAAGFALVFVLSGKKHATKHSAATPGSGSEHAGSNVPPRPDGSGAHAIAVQPDAGVAEPPPPKSTTCKVSVTSVPTAADIYLGKKQVGTTPADVEVPCDVSTTLQLRKAKFTPTDREVTAKADKPNKVLVKLDKPTVTIKVTSVPSGATITVGGKSMGVTPAKITLPAMEAVAIVLSKPGYQSDTTKMVPKTNNSSVRATLKKRH